jgi:hypothetical protein
MSTGTVDVCTTSFNLTMYGLLLLLQVAASFDLSDQSKAPKLVAESTWNYEI